VGLRIAVATLLTASVVLSGLAASRYAASLLFGVSGRLILVGAIFVLGPLVGLVVAQLVTAGWRERLRLGWSGRELLSWTWTGVLLGLPTFLGTALVASSFDLPLWLHQSVIIGATILCVFLVTLAGTWRAILSIE